VKDETQALAETVVSGEAGLVPRAEEAEDQGLIGAKLDHFVIERRLGHGGMGEVYAARDTSLDRPVAIKVLRGHVMSQPGMAERFLREARAQARFTHPNIVDIYYVGRRPTPSGEDSLFFAMELIEGGDLDDLLRRGETMPPEDARIAMIQVARGLRAAQHAEVIHRDVKPSNLMVGTDGVIKLADFGLAKPVDGDNEITQEGAIVGSPYYLSPEQALGDDLDHRADMYAMGAAFYHLLVGRPPFEGPRPMAVVAKHLSEPPTPLAKSAPHVPAPLARVVERLLAKKAHDRYPDYDTLIEELERAAPQRQAYAPFTTRAVAALGDFFVAGILIGFLGWIGLVIYAAIVTIGHAWRGQSPAKFLFGIEVRRNDGGKLGFVRSLLRTAASLWMPIFTAVTIAATSGIDQLLHMIESLRPADLPELRSLLMAMAISQGFMTLLYLAGLCVALFHPQRKTLHDLLLRTVVTYRLKNEAPPRSTQSASSVRGPSTDRSRSGAKKQSSRPPPRDAA
jgi:uncharacterized RDD family membrane protein YckC